MEFESYYRIHKEFVAGRSSEPDKSSSPVAAKLNTYCSVIICSPQVDYQNARIILLDLVRLILVGKEYRS
jgi:hypothetical protein